MNDNEFTHMNLSNLATQTEIHEWNHHGGNRRPAADLLRKAAQWLDETNAELVATTFTVDGDGEHLMIIVTRDP